MNKKIFYIGCFLLLLFLVGCSEKQYTYIGTIKDMKGGLGENLILSMEDGQKIIYSPDMGCAYKLRIGQKLYNMENSGIFKNLWVEYEQGKYC